MHQRSAIALQTPSGMHFGNVLRIRSDTLTIELEQQLQERTVIQWRMELSGHSDTVMGELKVLRVRQRPDGMQRCSCRILSMPTRDRARLTAWLKEQATGGTTRRYDDDISAITQNSDMSSTTMTETRNALNRMSRRKWYNSNTSPTRDTLGLNSEIKDDGSSRRTGRAALRSALRTSMARKKVRANTMPPAEVMFEDTTETAQLPDPTIVHIPHTDPPRVHVRYRSPSLYREEHHKHIRCSALFLPLPELGDDGTRVIINIEPPGRESVRCRAEIKVKMSTGVGVALRLNDEQKSALQPQRTP